MCCFTVLGPRHCQKLAYWLLRPAHNCKGKASFSGFFFAGWIFFFFSVLALWLLAFGSWLVWLLWLLWLLRLLSFSFTILYLFPHAICSILGPQPVTLHAICSILGPQPVSLHAICSIVETSTYHFACYLHHFGDLNLSF